MVRKSAIRTRRAPDSSWATARLTRDGTGDGGGCAPWRLPRDCEPAPAPAARLINGGGAAPNQKVDYRSGDDGGARRHSRRADGGAGRAPAPAPAPAPAFHVDYLGWVLMDHRCQPVGLRAHVHWSNCGQTAPNREMRADVHISLPSARPGDGLRHTLPDRAIVSMTSAALRRNKTPSNTSKLILRRAGVTRLSVERGGESLARMTWMDRADAVQFSRIFRVRRGSFSMNLCFDGEQHQSGLGEAAHQEFLGAD